MEGFFCLGMAFIIDCDNNNLVMNLLWSRLENQGFNGNNLSNFYYNKDKTYIQSLISD